MYLFIYFLNYYLIIFFFLYKERMRQYKGAPLGLQLFSKYGKNDIPGALWEVPQAVQRKL